MLTEINDVIIKKYRFRDAKDNLLLIVFSADKGFCGSFNSSVIKKTVEVFNKNTENYKNIDILPVGKKALAYFKKNNFKIINDFSDIFAKLQVEKIHEFAEWLRLGFLENRYDKVFIVFNSFKNAASQEVTVKQFLPMVIEEQEAIVFPEEYIFEPSRSEILESFIPFVLKTELTHLLFESNASEQGARMTNMMKSTDNADALIKSLRILYNQSRQAMITNEIIEISAGANAIK